MNPLTQDEKARYRQDLLDAAEIVQGTAWGTQEIPDEVFIPVMLRVFDKIASPLYFLRQEPQAPEAKKPSRIYGEGTQWTSRTAKKTGLPYESASQDKLFPADQQTLQEVREQPDAPMAKGEYRYWAHEWQGKWYLNRRRLT